MDEYHIEDFTPAHIISLSSEIRDGVARPDIAMNLLRFFCHCVDAKKELPAELLSHFRDSFASIIDGTQTIERALGLARKPNRPKADRDFKIDMARHVLLMRLNGMTHQEALAETCKIYGPVESVVGEAWSAEKREAYNLERIERHVTNTGWSEAEINRLKKIFIKARWFTPPGKPGSKPA